MALGIVCIITDAQKDAINLVFVARGDGPETFTRKICAADPDATPETTPTHWLMSDANGDDAELSILMAMTQGNLPDLPDGVVWGEDGVISEADAIAATDGAVFQVYSAGGDIEPVDHVAAVLASRDLQYVPEPEI